MWSPDSLPVITNPNTVRALFSPATGFSINDEYSISAPSDSYSSFTAILVPCESSNVAELKNRACVSSIEYRKIGATTWRIGKLSKTQLSDTPTQTLKKDPKFKIVVGSFDFDAGTFRPQGGKAMIWNFDAAPHVGGTNYLLRARITSPGADEVSSVDGKLQRILRVELLPISSNANSNVISQGEYEVEKFPEDFEFRLTLDLGVFLKSIPGWFFGRLNNPDINMNFDSGKLVITSQPVKVPIGVTQLLQESDVKQILAKCPINDYCGSTYPLWGKYSLFDSEERINPEILSEFEKLKGGVSTISTNTYWGLDSTRLGEAIQNTGVRNDCLLNLSGNGNRVFLGVVASNATMFQTTAPTWDSEERTFSFKVASPHLDENMKPNLGTYTLAIPENQAICRWGASALKSKAILQIINADGSSKVSTAVTQVRNGMMYFNVAGFSYSSPVIKFSLSQEPAQDKKIISIVCVKGSRTKKVSGVNPACPAGYKKSTIVTK
jgi:hypothetical protein